MNFKNLSTITAAGSLINGLFYLLLPAFSLSLLGAAAGPIGLVNTRAAGAIALGMCVINWLARNFTERAFQRTIIAGNLTMFAALTVIEIHATLSATMNWVGWAYIAADGFLAAGYAVLLKRSWGD